MIKSISVTFRVLVCLMLNFTQGIAGELAGYRVGESVQLKINDSFWQDCVVSENPPEGIMRVNCTEFREPSPGTYSRAGGTYIVYGASELRRPGAAATSSVQNVRPDVVASSPTDPSPGQVSASSRLAEASDLRIGEYACYGSGGTILWGVWSKGLA